MSRPRSGTRGVARAEREASILDAAITEFAAGGYRQTSVGAIAARAHVSKALVLAYFGSKDELYLRGVRAVAEPMLATITEVVDTAAPGWPMALETLRATFESVAGRPRDWHLVNEEALPADGRIAAEVTEIRDAFRRLGTAGVRDALAAHPHDGGDDADVELMAAMWNAVVRSVMTWWAEHPAETAETVLLRCYRILGSLNDSVDAAPGEPAPGDAASTISS